MGLSRSINPTGGASIGNKAAMVPPTSTGLLYLLRSPIKPPVTWSKVSGHANLSISGSSIALAQAIASGATQSIVVRAANGTTAVEYQVTLTGAAGVPTLTATPATAAITSKSPIGTVIAAIGNIPAGATATVDNVNFAVSLAGKVITAATDIAAGTVNITVSAPGANPVTIEVTVTAAAATPDGPMEAEIVPPNSTQRSTYAFIKSDGFAIPVYPQMAGAPSNQYGYWHGGGIVKAPSAQYPDRRFAYTSLDHGPATVASHSGFYVSVCISDPSVATNWLVYEDAVAAGWLNDIPNKPASNPIYQGAPGVMQPETPWVQWVTDDDGVSNGMFVMSYQTGGNAISAITGAVLTPQITLRATSTDGINWTGDRVAWSEHTNKEAQTIETTYLRWGHNKFLTEIPYKYVGYSVGGQYGLNDPRTERWKLITLMDNQTGRVITGLTSGYMLAKGRYDPTTMQKTRNGVSMHIHLGLSSSGKGMAAGEVYEAEFALDGREIISKPFVLTPRSTASGDAASQCMGAYGTYGDKRFLMLEAGGNIDATVNKKRGIVASSPILNPLNTVFPPLTPATPSGGTKKVYDFTQGVLPASLNIAGASGAPVVSWSAEDGMVIQGVAGDSIVVCESASFDPRSLSIVDVLIDEVLALQSTSNPDALRRPWVGFTNEPGALAAMQNVRAVTYRTTDNASAQHIRTGGAVTEKWLDSGFNNPFFGYGTANAVARTRRGAGMRWWPNSPNKSSMFLTNGGIEKVFMAMDFASLDYTKPLFRFIAFEFTGATTVAIRKFISRQA